LRGSYNSSGASSPDYLFDAIQLGISNGIQHRGSAELRGNSVNRTRVLMDKAQVAAIHMIA
jgi:hypothetical protein